MTSQVGTTTTTNTVYTPPTQPLPKDPTNCYFSGDENYSERMKQNMKSNFKNKFDECDCCYDVIGIPCCVGMITKSWEEERDQCAKGNYCSGVSWGLCNRVSNACSFFWDLSLLACIPLACVCGLAKGACCCLNAAGQYSRHCCSSSPGAEIDHSAHKAIVKSANAFYSTIVGPLALVGTAVLDAAKLPCNLLAPEILNRLLFQQECLNLQVLMLPYCQKVPCINQDIIDSDSSSSV